MGAAALHDAATLTCRLQVTGQLQGVGYRWSLAQLARSLGLSGWVRKQPDGQVLAVVSGPSDAVQDLIAWARRGPCGAQVHDVQVSEADGPFDGFEQLETGWQPAA